jgi:hypothetical protein
MRGLKGIDREVSFAGDPENLMFLRRCWKMRNVERKKRNILDSTLHIYPPHQIRRQKDLFPRQNRLYVFGSVCCLGYAWCRRNKKFRLALVVSVVLGYVKGHELCLNWRCRGPNF